MKTACSFLILLMPPLGAETRRTLPPEATPFAAGRLCMVAIQDRSPSPVLASGLDRRAAAAMRAHGIQPAVLAFEPPADVEHAARIAGCSHILYTDLLRAEEKGSPVARACRRLFSPGSGPETKVFIVEIEFRLFLLDRMPPLLSASAAASSKGAGTSTADLSPSDRLTDTWRDLAFTKALGRQAKAVREALQNADLDPR